MKIKGSNFHPARISNRQKLLRAREVNKMLEGKKKVSLNEIKLDKSNWSIKN